MRRGLMAWSRDEAPAGVLERRVSRLLQGLRERSLHCVLAYTDLTRPAAVSALTHFVPYWSNGVLVVSPTIGATLVATLSRRVGDWIESTARLDAVVHTLDLGAGVAQALHPSDGEPLRVGVVDLASFPASVLAAAQAAHAGVRFEEAGDLLEQSITPDESLLICERTREVALSALEAASAACASGQAAQVLAAAERAGRRAGAEELLLAIAPDVRAGDGLRRLEGHAALGDVFAVQATVAYKGCWIRVGRTLGPGAAVWGARADEWFARITGRIAAGEAARDALASVRELDGAGALEWRIEAPVAGLPLAVVDGSGVWSAAAPSQREPRSLTVRLRLPQGSWYGAAPVLRQTFHSRERRQP